MKKERGKFEGAYKHNLKTKKLCIIIFIIAILISSIFVIRNKIYNKLILSPEIARYNSYNKITDEDAIVEDCEYVTFSAFFTRDLDNDGYVEKYDGTCNYLNTTANLYFDINVLTEGTLKNGKISINGRNFSLTTSLVKDEVLKNDYIGSDTRTVEFNDLNCGTQKLFSGTIEDDIDDNINNYSREDNSVVLTGIWESADGKQSIEITKEIYLTVDWFGTTTTLPYTDNISTTHNISSAVEEKYVTLDFYVGFQEIVSRLLLQKQITEVTIPKLNGYDPISVSVDSSNCMYEYDQHTRILTITRESKLDSVGTIISSISRRNTYAVSVKYDINAYRSIGDETISVTIPTKGYYYGYNNTSKEFENRNPYVSSATRTYTHTWENPTGLIAKFDVFVGKNTYNSDTGRYEYRVSKDLPLQIYNKIEAEENASDEYIVQWRACLGEFLETQNGISMQETSNDKFLNSNGTYIDMKDYIKTKGIYFSETASLADDGFIKVYDGETDELLVTFTKSNWNSYYSNKPYYFDREVKSIKVETSKMNISSCFYVYQVKEIDDKKLTQQFSESDFANLNYIYSYLTGDLILTDSSKMRINTDQEYSSYEVPVSVAEFSVLPKSISNQETKNIIMTIQTIASYYNEKKWKNGLFVIELPKTILGAEIKNVSIDNSNVKISSYEIYEQNGSQYIRIYTQNETEEAYKLTIETSVIADPRKATTTQSIKLYAINENCNNYRVKVNDSLDIDRDGNYNENVLYKAESMTFVAPSTLMTFQTLSNFDDKGSEAVSPQIAVLDKSDNTRTADVNVSIVNNYYGTISDAVVVGKIPFEHNTYQVNGNSLGSMYNTSMTGGITVPEKIAEYVKVYYSSDETVSVKNGKANISKMLTADEVTDWNTIKTYVIDLSEYTLAKNEQLTFTYEIKIPQGLDYNDISYSTHAIYFCLDTSEGKLRTQTEANRLGIIIAKKYNLNLTKYKADTEKLVSGATYKAFAGEDFTKTGVTDSNGKCVINGLYVYKEYILKEIQSPSNYALNEDEIKFVVKLDDDENPYIEIEGNLREDATIATDEQGNTILNIVVEDVAKYDFKIIKTNLLGEPIKDIKFKIVGGIYGESGRNFSSKMNGEIVITDLIPDTTYTIFETKADGYYVDDSQRTFKIIRNADGKLQIITDDEILSNAIIVETDDVDKAEVTVNITNEEIPIYSLKLVKVEKNNQEILLQGAKFELTSTDTQKTTLYTTDENGQIEIDGLYRFVDGKNITGRYTLREIMAPKGYSNNGEKINFVTTQNNDGTLSVEVENQENLTTLVSAKIENDTLVLIIENDPSFKLTKVDSDSDESLSNISFIIYEIDQDGRTIDYAVDINGNYVGEQNEAGDYIVTTDESGIIRLPLRPGYYKCIEINTPEGYDESKDAEFFVIEESAKDNTEEIPDKNEEEEPIELLEISSIEDLVEFSNKVNSGNNYAETKIILTRTLDFNEEDSYESGAIDESLISGTGFTPIGSADNYFAGIFDGQGYEIRNLYINTSTNCVGLFAEIGGAVIKNLGVTGEINCANSTANYRYVGGIVGYSRYGTVIRCYSECNVNSSCSTYSYVGGIAGYAMYSTVSNCYNTGNISSTVNSSYSYAGGIVGYVNSGIALSNCYNLGNVSSTGSSSIYGGEIVGYLNSSITENCYYLDTIKLTTTTTTRYGIAVSDEYMKSQEFYEQLNVDGSWKYVENSYAKINFNVNDNSGEDTVREILEISSIEDLVEFSNAVNNGYKYSETKIILTRDLDFNDSVSYESGVVDTSLTNETGFRPIGYSSTNYFGGIFDGQGFEIRNLYEDTTSFAGLFGHIGGAVIKNVGITGQISCTSSSYSYTGGIAGYASYSTISNCYSKVDASSKISSSGATYDGGIVGYLYNSTITNSNSSGNINSITTAYGTYVYGGGIAGYINSSKISDSYNTGSVSNDTNIAISYAGGIVGYAYGEVENCYNIGDVLCDSQTGNTSAGGIIGYISSNNIIKNCHNEGCIKSVCNDYSSYAGGIIGRIISTNTIESCYNTGEIICNNTTSTGYSGGVVGYIQSGDNIISYCYNEGYIVSNNDEYSSLAGGIVGYIYNGSTISDCYNIGVISSNTNTDESYAGGIVGDVYLNTTIKNCYNTGNIDSISTSGEADAGGITAYLYTSTVRNCYNTGTISNRGSKYSSSAGGIVGFVFNGNIVDDCYNEGDIINNNDGSRSYTGGIAGYTGSNNQISNSYNIGDVTGISNSNYSSSGGIIGYSYNSNIINCCYNTGAVNNTSNSNNSYSGGIIGYETGASVINNCYNNGYVASCSNDVESYSIAGGITGYLNSSAISNSYNIGNISSIGNGYNHSGGIVGLSYDSPVNNSYYLESITTISNSIGITFSSEYMKSKDFYEILNKDDVWVYIENSYPKLDGYLSKLSSATEITIKNTARKFQITTEVEKINNVKGGTISGENQFPYEMVNYGGNNSKEILMTPDEGYEIIKITVNGKEIEFSVNEDGTYLMPQFTNVIENYHIVVTYALSTNKIIINKVDSKTKEKLSNAKFIIEQIRENESTENIIGEVVQNDETYNSIDANDEEIIDVLGELTNNGTYYFTESNEKYVSNNQGINSTTANSYIPIDLREYDGIFNLILNAEISSEKACDYGYATITKTTEAPTYEVFEGQFIKISGDTEAKDYTTILNGGELYYLHLGYCKDEYDSSGDDTFIINSISLKQNKTIIELKTNAEGQASAGIPYGTYSLREIQAPEEYILNPEPIIIEFTEDGPHEFTVENTKKSKVVAHHLLAINNGDGTYTYTDQELIEQEVFMGIAGEKYTTSPNLYIDGYKLITDENGEYILPDNAVGYYDSEETVEVNYYYEKRGLTLIVHHYLEGTEDSLVEDEIYEDVYIEGDEYISKANEKLLEKYVVLENLTTVTPGDNAINAGNTVSGTINESTVITYYYSLKGLKITTEVKLHEEIDIANKVTEIKGGNISGENDKPYETVLVNENSKKDIVIKADEGYEIKSIIIEIYNEDGTVKEEKLQIEDNLQEYVLDKFMNVTSDVRVIVEFQKARGRVIVHHYIEGTTTKVPSNIEGQVVEDEVKTGAIGAMFATKPSESISDKYGYSSSSEITSGKYTEEVQEVNYYYGLKTTVTVNYIDKNTGNLLDTLTEEKLAGNQYTSIPKDFDNYILVEKPVEETVILSETETVLNYYYVRISSGMIEKHIDIKSNEVLHDEIHEGDIGTPYTTSLKEFEGYDVVTNKQYYEEYTEIGLDKLIEKEVNKFIEENYDKDSKDDVENGIEDDIQDNTEDGDKDNIEDTTEEIKITEEEINQLRETKLAELLTRYVSTTKEELIENHKQELVEEILTKLGLQADENYIPENANGVLTDEAIEVKYYYIRKATITVKYIDKITGELLEPETKYDGYEGKEYKTNSKEFEGYELVTEKLPTNTEGKMTRETIEVKYYYKKVETKEPDKEKPSPSQEQPNNPSQPSTQEPSKKQPSTQVPTVKPQSTSNKTPVKAPATGDILPVIALITVFVVLTLNVIQIVISKRKKVNK